MVPNLRSMPTDGVMTDPISVIEDALNRAGKNVKRKGEILEAQCPAHSDGNPSLSVAPGMRRDVVIYCHAGCKADDVMAALSLKWTDLGDANPKTQSTAEWDYHDAKGRVLYRVVKTADKKFFQQRYDPNTSKYISGLDGMQTVPYRLPQLRAAVEAGQTIYIAEGEKDCDALIARGVTATCNPGGAKKFRQHHAAEFKGAAKVIIVADRDQPGVEHANEVVGMLALVGVFDVDIVQAKQGKDAADHFAFGHGLDDFVPLGAVGNEPTEQTWPQPESLGVGKPPPWPTNVFPDWMEEMVTGVAEELQTPRDLGGMLALGMLAVIHGGRVTVRIKGAWSEHLNLYTVTALPPSVGKSPAVKLIFRPVTEWLESERERVAPAIERAKQERRMVETDMGKAEKAGERAQAAGFLDELNAINVPVMPQLWTDDATPEAFVKRLHEHGGRMSILSTEGGVFQLMAGRYSDQMANLDPYLKAWSGDEIVVDRVGRDSYIIPKPATSIVLTVQPSVLQQVGENVDNRNRGLPARFMMSIPETNVGHRNMIDGPELDDDVAEHYGEMVHKIISAAECIPHGATMRLSPSARRGFLLWRQDLERRQLSDLSLMEAWTAKLASSVARTAALLHLAQGRDITDDIDDETMAKAISIGVYWIEHARIAHQLWDADSALAGARAVVAKMVETSATETTARDLMRTHRQRFRTIEDLVPSLHLLIDRGWMRSSCPQGEVKAARRGDDSPRLVLHPESTALWINPPHVTHVPHVPKDVIQSTSSSSSEKGHPPDMRDMGDMTGPDLDPIVDPFN